MLLNWELVTFVMPSPTPLTVPSVSATVTNSGGVIWIIVYCPTGMLVKLKFPFASVTVFAVTGLPAESVPTSRISTPDIGALVPNVSTDPDRFWVGDAGITGSHHCSNPPLALAPGCAPNNE